MNISIVIPAFNEERLLPETLAAVENARAAWDSRGWSSEVIVCDNRSTDATASVAAAAGARVVHEPVNQIGRARNTGAQAATGDWLLFLDADSLPTRALFAAVADAVEDPRCLGGGTTLQLDGGPVLGHLITAVWNGWSRSTCWIAGAFLFVETRAFRELGGFDLRLFASEEIDLSRRLKRYGRRARRRLVILSGTPLLTSCRKTKLYRPGELIRFFLRALFRPFSTLTSPEACHPWYDGRR